MYNAKYNPKTRNYEVQNEDGQAVESFPAGDAGRQAAKERAIQFNNPQVYRLAWYYAHDLFRTRRELFNRIWSAAEAVINEQATYRMGADPAHLIARVKSSSQTRWDELFDEDRPVEYGINKTPDGRYRCQCFDYHNAAPKIDGQPMCKHVIAAKILVGIHPQKYAHMHGLSQDMLAALESGYHAAPPPQPAAANDELTAALRNMRRKQARYMTDLTPAEIDELLDLAPETPLTKETKPLPLEIGQSVPLPADLGHCGRGGTVTGINGKTIRVAYQSEQSPPGIDSYASVNLDELNALLFD